MLIFKKDDWPYPSNAFRPTIESLWPTNTDAFLTESPVSIYQNNEVAKIPWIVTTVSGEGYSFLLCKCLSYSKNILQLKLSTPYLTIYSILLSVPYIIFTFKTVLRKNWYKLAPDLVDIDNFENLDFASITNQITEMYFKRTPPENATIHPYAKVASAIASVQSIFFTY
jgi:hypothetical protein